MATKRQKKTIITGVSKETAEEAFAAYAKAAAEAAKLTAEVELACAKIREKYQERLNAAATRQDEAFATLQAYAVENQAELFAKKKSLEMVHGVIGFRTGQPKLKTTKGHTWASALELVKEYLPGYVRTAEEIAKDRLLADRDGDAKLRGEGEEIGMVAAMAKCGILVVQDESFYVEPKREEVAGA